METTASRFLPRLLPCLLPRTGTLILIAVIQPHLAHTTGEFVTGASATFAPPAPLTTSRICTSKAFVLQTLRDPALMLLSREHRLRRVLLKLFERFFERVNTSERRTSIGTHSSKDITVVTSTRGYVFGWIWKRSDERYSASAGDTRLLATFGLPPKTTLFGRVVVQICPGYIFPAPLLFYSLAK
jgi:hypothetical protein